MRLFRIMLLVLLSLLVLVPAKAQNTTRVPWDGTRLIVEFPADWEVTEQYSETTALVLSDGNLSMWFYYPRQSVETAREELTLLADENPDFEWGKIYDIDLIEGYIAANFQSDTLTGFSTAFEFDGDVLLIDSFVGTDEMTDEEYELAINVMSNISVGEERTQNNSSNTDSNVANWVTVGLSVAYPEGWEATERYDDNTALVLTDGFVSMWFYYPRSGDTALEELENLIEENPDFEWGDIAEVNGLDGFYSANFDAEDISGFSTTLSFDGQVLLVDTFAASPLSKTDIATAMEILGGMEISGEIPASSDALGSVFGTAEEQITELIELGLVSDDGSLLFAEDMLGMQEDDTAINQAYDSENIAMGALISWRAVGDDSEYRICGLVAESDADSFSDSRGDMLVVGFDSDNDVATLEFDIANGDNSTYDYTRSGVDIYDPQHLLFIVNDDRLTVYVNGEIVVEDWELTITTDNKSLFAGYVLDLGCVMTDVWAYSFD